jgi:hypothetical protein
MRWGCLKQAGLLETEYAGHSFRNGVATTAAKKSLEDSLIQTLGRWQSIRFRLLLTLHIPFAILSCLFVLLHVYDVFFFIVIVVQYLTVNLFILSGISF